MTQASLMTLIYLITSMLSIILMVSLYDSTQNTLYLIPGLKMDLQFSKKGETYLFYLLLSLVFLVLLQLIITLLCRNITESNFCCTEKPTLCFKSPQGKLGLVYKERTFQRLWPRMEGGALYLGSQNWPKILNQLGVWKSVFSSHGQ